MCRNRMLPPARAALTMTLTAGFCIAGSSVIRQLTTSGRTMIGRGKEQGGAVAAAQFTIHHMDPAPETGVATTPAHVERIRIVLVGTQHPGNIGAAARAMKTMGLRRLVLVAPMRFPH